MRALLLTVSLLYTAAAHAQVAYPVKPVRIIVPCAPGGGTDITTRALNLRFTEYFGQPFVVENRGGAATVIGTDHVVKQARIQPE